MEYGREEGISFVLIRSGNYFDLVPLGSGGSEHH